MQGSYDYRLVAFSVVLAIFAAYAALDLAGRVTAAQRRSRLFWIAGGAVSMGLGIWATHYIGMLAFTLPVPVFYHYPSVLLSLLTAVAASAVALFTASRERMDAASLTAGSLIMASGIAAMHFIGMKAMRLSAVAEYRPGRVWLSFAFAAMISFLALDLAFRSRHDQNTSSRKVLGSLIMVAGLLWCTTRGCGP